MFVILRFLAIFAALCTASAAFGQQAAPPPSGKSAPIKSAKPQAQKAPDTRPVPLEGKNAAVLSLMVRSALIALDHANRTGDYSVFHAMLVPAQRNRFTPADYAEHYAPLRKAKLALLPALAAKMQFTKPPHLDKGGLLHIEGRFLTQPKNLGFRTVFMQENKEWMLLTLKVGTIEPPPSPLASAPLAPSASGQAAASASAAPAPAQRSSERGAAMSGSHTPPKQPVPASSADGAWSAQIKSAPSPR